MNKRQAVLNHMAIAGYNNDRAAWMRLYTENRISRSTADKAWLDGQYKKESES